MLRQEFGQSFFPLISGLKWHKRGEWRIFGIMKTEDETIKEMAAVLRSTEQMAASFATRIQERLGQDVSFIEILDVMKKISATRLSMDRVVFQLRRRLKL